MITILLIAFLTAFFVLTCVCVVGVVLSQVSINKKTMHTRKMAEYAVDAAEKAIDDTSKLDAELSTLIELFKGIRDKLESQPEESADKPPDDNTEAAQKKNVEEQFERMQDYQPVNYGLTFGGADEDNNG